MAALWRAYRTKHYGPHAKALRARRARAGLPEDPPPFGSNRMIKSDVEVLRRWEEKKAALARRAQLPSHETLLQQHARKRAWSQQRSDDKPAATVHWSTRSILRTVKSHDSMRPEAMRPVGTPKSKRKSDAAVGDFGLLWLRSVGACGWVQHRIVMLLQITYRCAFCFCSSHRIDSPPADTHGRSHLARRLLAHVTLQKDGFARTRLRSPVKSRSTVGSRSEIERPNVMNAYCGRKSVLYAMMHSDDNRPSTGSPSKSSRGNRNERLGQLFAFAGRMWVDRCLARWLWYYAWRLEHKRQTKESVAAYKKMGSAKVFRLYRDAALAQKALKAKLAIATGGATGKLTSLTFHAWHIASGEKKRVTHAVKTLVRKIWREVLLESMHGWREVAAEQACERKKANRVETLQEEAKRCVLLVPQTTRAQPQLTLQQAHGRDDAARRVLRLVELVHRDERSDGGGSGQDIWQQPQAAARELVCSHARVRQ